MEPKIQKKTLCDAQKGVFERKKILKAYFLISKIFLKTVWRNEEPPLNGWYSWIRHRVVGPACHCQHMLPGVPARQPLSPPLPSQRLWIWLPTCVEKTPKRNMWRINDKWRVMLKFYHRKSHQNWLYWFMRAHRVLCIRIPSDRELFVARSYPDPV